MGGQAKTLSELGLTAQRGADRDHRAGGGFSREVKEGYLCSRRCPARGCTGRSSFQYALRMGAGAVLTDMRRACGSPRRNLSGSDAALVISEDPRQVLAYTAALWFGAPARR